MLDFVDDVSGDLGSKTQLAYVEKMLSRGTGADRQLRVFEQEKNLNAVVDYIISESKEL
jgi:carboxylate-amine ligase